MDDFDFSLIDEQFDHIHESEEDDWTSAVLGDEDDVIRQLVG